MIAKLATAATWFATRPDRGATLIPPVLCYHRVLPKGARVGAAQDYSVTPEQFAAQMAFLAREGFTSLSLEEYFQATQGLRTLPRRSVLVTFDDGFEDNYLQALPIARRFGVTLNMFVCTGLIAGERVAAFDPSAHENHSHRPPSLSRPMSWRQLREMAAEGVGIGFHSHHHRNLARLSTNQLVADVERGLGLFERELGQPARFFAFPFGHYGSYSDTVISTLKEFGLQMFFTTELGRTPLQHPEPIVSRVVIHREDDSASFERKIFGGYDWVGRVRKSVYSLREQLINNGPGSRRGRTPANGTVNRKIV